MLAGTLPRPDLVATSMSSMRLRVSSPFVLAFSMDGRPYVAQETEPYIQYWLTDRHRLLLAMFSGRRGATAAHGIEASHSFAQHWCGAQAFAPVDRDVARRA